MLLFREFKGDEELDFANGSFSSTRAAAATGFATGIMLLFDQRLSLEKDVLSSMCTWVRSGIGIVAMSTLRRNEVARVERCRQGEDFLTNVEFGQELCRENGSRVGVSRGVEGRTEFEDDKSEW